MTPIPKPGILDIRAYQPGAAKAPGVALPLKLSANENALGCSEAARAAYLRAASEIHLYPDASTSRLRNAIAEKYNLETARLVFGAGSDEIFSMVTQAYLDRGDNIVQPEYGFAAWAIAARAAGGGVISAPERDYSVDVDAIVDAVDRRTRVVFIANPANPTGSCISFAEIQRLHGAIPESAVLVLDCAYAEAATENGDYSDGLQWARDKSNVIVTRTFSKLYGLASLRVGWAYAPTEVAEVLNRIRLPFSVSRAGEAAAVAALADHAFLEQSAQLVFEERRKLATGLRRLGLRVLPSSGNFVTASFDSASCSADETLRSLMQRGVLVRGLGSYGMPNWIRFSIGRSNENDRLLAELSDVLTSA